ncbi:MAG: ABC transporter ATP-binding protein [Nitrospirota bacterium]|nr:MAG: ABC transporter ATP-binding protein [Nitrospirota bacterium]
MIQLTNVSKTYEVGDQPVHALVDVTERIQTGEFVAIMGSSGSGKSTLLNLLGCLLRPSAGSYTLNGQDIGTLSDVELSRLRQKFIGFIFQSFHLVPRLTAAGNVELPMMFAGISTSERQRRAREALEAVGLTERAKHLPAQLSVGQRQRVVIARATIMRPQLILADEPTGNLDRASSEQILKLLDQLHAQGQTLIMVTHEVDVARRAERVLVIDDGQIVQRIKSDALIRDPVLHPAVK